MSEFADTEASIRREEDRGDLLFLGYTGGVLLETASIYDLITSYHSVGQAIAEAALGAIFIGVTEFGRIKTKSPTFEPEITPDRPYPGDLVYEEPGYEEPQEEQE